jgi:hypothetical protein
MNFAIPAPVIRELRPVGAAAAVAAVAAGAAAPKREPIPEIIGARNPNILAHNLKCSSVRPHITRV